MNAYAFPPIGVRVVEVVLVDCQRGEGDLRRGVLQVFSKDGELLAEHDWLHGDPEYAAYFLRDRTSPETARTWEENQARIDAACPPLSLCGVSGKLPVDQALTLLRGSIEKLRAIELHWLAAKAGIGMDEQEVAHG